jgi:paraquat-inducible protein B
MKIRFNPLLLGVFVIGGVAIAVLILLGLGSSYFHPIGYFDFYLPDSAGGLDQGSGVSLNGVRVGQIDRIAVFYNPKLQNSFVRVTCEIDKNLLTDTEGNPIDIRDRKNLTDMIAKGLVVQVQTAGLVGNEYVELGFNSSTKPIELAGAPASPRPVIPVLPSTMSQLMDNLSGTVANLHKIDYHALVEQVNGVLVAAHGQINELQTNHLTDHISTAAQSVGDFVSSSDLRSAVARLQDTASAFQGLAKNLNAQVAPAATNLNATLNSAKQSLETLQDFLQLRNQLGEQTYQLMDQLNETARSVQQLSDFLQRHPDALITGRAKQNDIIKR